MAPRVAIAQAKVGRAAGRGSHRSVHFLEGSEVVDEHSGDPFSEDTDLGDEDTVRFGKKVALIVLLVTVIATAFFVFFYYVVWSSYSGLE